MTTEDAKIAETSCSITPETTFARLAELRARYGVIQLRFDYEHFRSVDDAHVAALLVTTTFTVIGRGHSEWKALDDGFSRLIHRIGQHLRDAVKPMDFCNTKKD